MYMLPTNLLPQNIEAQGRNSSKHEKSMTEMQCNKKGDATILGINKAK